MKRVILRVMKRIYVDIFFDKQNNIWCIRIFSSEIRVVELLERGHFTECSNPITILKCLKITYYRSKGCLLYRIKVTDTRIYNSKYLTSLFLFPEADISKTIISSMGYAEPYEHSISGKILCERVIRVVFLHQSPP